MNSTHVREIHQLWILISEVGQLGTLGPSSAFDGVTQPALVFLVEFLSEVDLLHAGRGDVVPVTEVAAHLDEIAFLQIVPPSDRGREHRIVPALIAVRECRARGPALAAMTSGAAEILERMLAHVGKIRVRCKRLREGSRQHGAPFVAQMAGDAAIDHVDFWNPDLLDAGVERARALGSAVSFHGNAKSCLDRSPGRTKFAQEGKRY